MPAREHDETVRAAGTELKYGDIVRLKSGSPPMTVVGSLDRDIRVSWFMKDGDEFCDAGTGVFPRAALELIEDD